MSIPNMNGTRVTYSADGSTIFIPLPRELWRPCGDCMCDECKANKKTIPGYVPSWDTLAVASKPDPTRVIQSSWTVHMPKLHR